jgi:hypothetical protein
MASLDDVLRDAFERQRRSEAYNFTIELRRTRALRSIADADRRRTETLRQAEELRQTQQYLNAAEAKRKAPRIRYFQGSAIEKFNQWKAEWILDGVRQRPPAADRPRHGKLVDPDTCPHFDQDGFGHCQSCGNFGSGLQAYKPTPPNLESLSSEDVALITELHASLHDPNTPIQFCTKPTCSKLRSNATRE